LIENFAVIIKILCRIEQAVRGIAPVKTSSKSSSYARKGKKSTKQGERRTK
jgi:hypothetical protein